MDELPEDVTREIYKAIFSVSDFPSGLIRGLPSEQYLLAREEYLKEYGATPLTANELNDYINSNPFTFSLFDSPLEYSGLFVSDESETLVFDSERREENGSYKTPSAFDVKYLVHLVNDNTISIDIGDYDDDIELNVLEDSYVINKYTKSHIYSDDVMTLALTDFLDMRLPNWLNTQDEYYRILPDLLSIYRILKERKKFMVIDESYAKKMTLKTLDNLYQRALKDDILYCYDVVLVQIYFYFSARVMNLPSSEQPEGNVILLHPRYHKELGKTPQLGVYLVNEPLKFVDYDEYIKKSRTHLDKLYAQLTEYITDYLR